MLIGKDYEKIAFDIGSWHLLDPGAFLGDLFIFLACLYCMIRLKKLPSTPFNQLWYWFYLVFGTGFMIGGFAHLFFQYWGIAGKYAPWYLALISTFLLEKAMISIHPNEKTKLVFNRVVTVKLVVILLLASYIYIHDGLTIDQKKALMIPTYNSVLGLGFGLLALGGYYSSVFNRSYRFFVYAGLLLIPSAVFQALKINFSAWIDRNAISHLLLVFSLILYLKGIKGYKDQKESSF